MQITFIDSLSNMDFIKTPFKKSPVFTQTSVVHQFTTLSIARPNCRASLVFLAETFSVLHWPYLAFNRISFVCVCVCKKELLHILTMALAVH